MQCGFCIRQVSLHKAKLHPRRYLLPGHTDGYRRYSHWLNVTQAGNPRTAVTFIPNRRPVLVIE